MNEETEQIILLDNPVVAADDLIEDATDEALDELTGLGFFEPDEDMVTNQVILLDHQRLDVDDLELA